MAEPHFAAQCQVSVEHVGAAVEQLQLPAEAAVAVLRVDQAVCAFGLKLAMLFEPLKILVIFEARKLAGLFEARKLTMLCEPLKLMTVLEALKLAMLCEVESDVSQRLEKVFAVVWSRTASELKPAEPVTDFACQEEPAVSAVLSCVTKVPWQAISNSEFERQC